MTTVIVPLDGSREAELAVPHARALAGTGVVVLLTCVWKGEPLAPRRYLEDRAKALAGTPVETVVRVDEPPAAAIVALHEARPDAVLCMTSHGRNAISQAILGSTAEEVLRLTTRPVLLVGPRAGWDQGRHDAATMAIAVDDETGAAIVVPAAAEFAARQRLDLWAVQSIAPAPYPFVADAAVAGTLSEAPGVTSAVEVLTDMGRAAETKVLVDVDPADAIVRFAADLPASVVAIGTHARTGLARIALGSVAMRVVHRSPCPVLVVPR